MARKLPATLATLLALAIAPAAAGAAHPTLGLDQNRAVAQPERTAQASTLVASVSQCPGQDNLSAPASVQEEAMRCMTNFARTRLSLTPLADAPELDVSANAKAADLLECDSFSHTACGRDFAFWMRESGYIGESCWHVGENLAWGTEEYGSVRSIFLAWMRSPTHRRNLLGEYSQTGISLEVGEFAGLPGARVWAQHFGTRCDPQPVAAVQ